MAFEEVVTGGGSLVKANQMKDRDELTGYIIGTEPNKYNDKNHDLIMVTPEGERKRVVVCGFLNKLAEKIVSGEEPKNVLYRFIRDESKDYVEQKFKQTVRGFIIQKDEEAKYEEPEGTPF